MKQLFAVFALAAVAASVRAAGTVQVQFVQPEKFADVRDQAFSWERNLDMLKRLLESAAAPYVADGQTLKIDVLDVDLAGEPKGGELIAIDRSHAGVGDKVLFTQDGKSAMQVLDQGLTPVDAAILGVIDSVEVL